MATTDQDIPLDYQWINWEHLYAYVGRAIVGDHVPIMTDKVAEYLENQARDMRRRAERLEVAAKAMREVRRAEGLPRG